MKPGALLFLIALLLLAAPATAPAASVALMVAGRLIARPTTMLRINNARNQYQKVWRASRPLKSARWLRW